MLVALFGPIVLTGLIVLISRLTGGGLRFMVNGDPWTYWFWYGLFYTLVLGGLMAMRTLLRLCPACGQPFCQYRGGTKVKTVTVGDARVRYGFRRSVFVTACVNCGVSVLGTRS